MTAKEILKNVAKPQKLFVTDRDGRDDVITCTSSTAAIVTNGADAEILRNAVTGENLNMLMIYSVSEDKLMVFGKTGREKGNFAGYLANGVYVAYHTGSLIEIPDDAKIICDVEKQKGTKYDQMPVWIHRIFWPNGEKKAKALRETMREKDIVELMADHLELLQTSERQGKNRDYYITEELRVTNTYTLPAPAEIGDIYAIHEKRKEENPRLFCKNEDGKFCHSRLAEYMIAHDHVCRVRYDGSVCELPYMYISNPNDEDVGTYTCDPEKFKERMCEYLPEMTERQRTEVYRNLYLSAPRRKIEEKDRRKIACKNGLLDIDTLKLSDWSPDFFALIKISYNWNENAYSEKIDNFLERFTEGDETTRDFIECSLGYTLYPQNFMKRCIPYFVSKPNSGKSVLLALYIKLLGAKNCSNIDPAKLTGDIFGATEILDKAALICDEMSTDANGYVSDTKILKQFDGKTPISVRFPMSGGVNKKPFGSIIPRAKMVLASNGLKKFRDPDGAFGERLIVIYCPHDFSIDEDCDPNFLANITNEDMEYVFLTAVYGLQEILDVKKMPIPTKSWELLELVIEQGDPVTAFCRTHGYNSAAAFAGKITKNVYGEYRDYTIDMGRDPDKIITQATFTRNICASYGLMAKQKRIQELDGRRENVFLPL